MTRWKSTPGWRLSLALGLWGAIATLSMAQSGQGTLAGAFKGRDSQPRTRDGLREPIYRVAEAPPSTLPVHRDPAIRPAGGETPVAAAASPTNTSTPPAAQPTVNEHPLEPVLKMAYRGLDEMNKNIQDYTATLVKRERINGKLGDYQYAFVKIRNQPLSVYMYFLSPANIRGREVIYVAGQNLDRRSGKAQLIAHDVGLRGIITVDLDPESPLAMEGQKYPIYKIGIRNLTQELIEHGEKDKQFGECDVKFFKGAKVQDRTCTCLQAVHPHRRPHFRFHLARVYIDDEYQIPIRYESYLWPTQEGGSPILDEEFTYMKLKLNVGLKDADFDRRNPNYKFR